jgi:hypothetical protein
VSGKAYISFRSDPDSEYDFVICSSYFVRGDRYWTVRLETIDGGVSIASSDRHNHEEQIPNELEARKQVLDATIVFAERLAQQAREAREKLEAPEPLLALPPCRSSGI